MDKLTDSCLCGSVSYQTTGPVLRFNVCHCDMCRKATGGPFGPFVRIKKTALPEELRTGDYIEFGLQGAYGSATTTSFNGFSSCTYVNVLVSTEFLQD